MISLSISQGSVIILYTGYAAVVVSYTHAQRWIDGVRSLFCSPLSIGSCWKWTQSTWWVIWCVWCQLNIIRHTEWDRVDTVMMASVSQLLVVILELRPCTLSLGSSLFGSLFGSSCLSLSCLQSTVRWISGCSSYWGRWDLLERDKFRTDDWRYWESSYLLPSWPSSWDSCDNQNRLFVLVSLCAVLLHWPSGDLIKLNTSASLVYWNSSMSLSPCESLFHPSLLTMFSLTALIQAIVRFIIMIITTLLFFQRVDSPMLPNQLQFLDRGYRSWISAVAVDAMLNKWVTSLSSQLMSLVQLSSPLFISLSSASHQSQWVYSKRYHWFVADKSMEL